jgi:hypothetical protein
VYETRSPWQQANHRSEGKRTRTGISYKWREGMKSRCSSSFDAHEKRKIFPHGFIRNKLFSAGVIALRGAGGGIMCLITKIFMIFEHSKRDEGKVGEVSLHAETVKFNFEVERGAERVPIRFLLDLLRDNERRADSRI